MQRESKEDDHGHGGPFPLDPSLVVESSPGHFHRYWIVADHGDAGLPRISDAVLTAEDPSPRRVTSFGESAASRSGAQNARLLKNPYDSAQIGIPLVAGGALIALPAGTESRFRPGPALHRNRGECATARTV
jgi:hypothetical protein